MTDLGYVNEDHMRVKVINAGEIGTALGGVVKANEVKRTTLKTWIVDPTGVAGQNFVQISDYEPNRYRIVIEPLDQDVVLCTTVPNVAPDTSTTSTAPQTGMYLPKSIAYTHEFFGPDAFWINSITGNPAGRVAVVKEYC